jgi:transposase InsO family protein
MPRIGTRKLYHLLREEFKREGISVGRDKLFTLLRQEHLLVGKRKRFTKTTNSHHWMRKHPDMIKDMTIERPEQLWVADITYVAIETGYAYLHLVTDAYSKQIMGYFVSTDLCASSTIKALTMALENRKYNNKLIHHSDRGLQYCSSGYVKILNENNVSISMTQSGSPYDNAIAERVNGILKDEFGLDQVFKNIEQLKKQTSESVKIYNEQRPHLSNEMLTPEKMHLQEILKPKKWNKKSTENLIPALL